MAHLAVVSLFATLRRHLLPAVQRSDHPVKNERTKVVGARGAEDYSRDEEISAIVQQLTAIGKTADPDFYGVAWPHSDEALIIYTAGYSSSGEAHLKQLYAVDSVRGRFPVTFAKSFISLTQGNDLIDALEAARPTVAAEHGLILTTYGPNGPIEAERPVLVTYDPKGAAPNEESLLRLAGLLPQGSMDLIVFRPSSVIGLDMANSA